MEIPNAEAVQVTEDELRVALSDGRSITVPLAWYPRLLHGTVAERGNVRMVGQGQGIHWEDLDEDISVEDLLAGRPSGESQASLRAWLAGRGMLDLIGCNARCPLVLASAAQRPCPSNSPERDRRCSQHSEHADGMMTHADRQGYH
ncbi:MAG: DUF2442 domain-containing protein [Dehalococcoidia bacterium]